MKWTLSSLYIDMYVHEKNSRWGLRCHQGENIQVFEMDAVTGCWLRPPSYESALHWWEVFNLTINRQSEYNRGQGVSEALRTSLRAVRGPALVHWRPGERREGRGAERGEEEKLARHPVPFQQSPKAQTKKIVAESTMPCLRRNEKIVCICPFCFLTRS